MQQGNRPWWQTGIVYQIYPRSFQDGNGDGVGDLPGIMQRLDYVHSLNVEAIWLSPIYPSPMADFGYDVADYTGIHPLFGTMADFDALLAAIHTRGMKLILDLVPNHTSEEHPWFRESRSSRDNARRDWYIWADPAGDGGPPNNWLSFFGGSAWAFDERTGRYYLHLFAREQPDLNYRNPAVLEAMLDNMRFWLDKGVDGFRVDVIWLMAKDELLRDEPRNEAWDGINPHGRLDHIYTAGLPEVHDIIRRMRQVVDAYEERVMIGEIYLSQEQLLEYYGDEGDECHMPFNFQLVHTSWNAGAVRTLVEEYEAALDEGQWPNWVLGNHDQHRIATRIGRAQARVAQMLLLTLRGTPTCYYGDEIGMENVPIPPEKVRDPQAVNQPEVAHLYGRDPVRTPMQWNKSAHAGFCPPDVEPWLPVATDFDRWNVAVEEQDPVSMLSLYRALSELRRAEPALHAGAYETVDAGPHAGEIYAFLRTPPADVSGDRFVVVLNLGNGARTLDLGAVGETAEIAFATGMERTGRVNLSALGVAPDEGLVLRL